jgi:hypothetical protein
MTQRVRILACVVGLWLVHGCGTLGTEPLGSDLVPNRGVGPYTLEEVRDGEVRQPTTVDGLPIDVLSPVVVVEQERVVLYDVAQDVEGLWRVVRRDSEDGWTFQDPESILFEANGPPWAQGPWEGLHVHHHGGSQFLTLVVAGGQSLALIPEGKNGFSFENARVIVEAESATRLGSPALVTETQGRVLYFDVMVEGQQSQIERARETDERWEREGGVFSSGQDCVNASGKESPCWDDAGVGQPDVRLTLGTQGDAVLRLFYVGIRFGKGHVGFAASWDGVTWERGAINPVFSAGRNEGEPSNLVFRDAYRLYMAQQQSTGERWLVLATDSRGFVSEFF